MSEEVINDSAPKLKDLSAIDRDASDFEEQIAEAKEYNDNITNLIAQRTLENSNINPEIYDEFLTNLLSEEGELVEKICRQCMFFDLTGNSDAKPSRFSVMEEADGNVLIAIMLARLYVEFDFIIWARGLDDEVQNAFDGYKAGIIEEYQNLANTYTSEGHQNSINSAQFIADYFTNCRPAWQKMIKSCRYDIHLNFHKLFAFALFRHGIDGITLLQDEDFYTLGFSRDECLAVHELYEQYALYCVWEQNNPYRAENETIVDMMNRIDPLGYPTKENTDIQPSWDALENYYNNYTCKDDFNVGRNKVTFNYVYQTMVCELLVKNKGFLDVLHDIYQFLLNKELVNALDNYNTRHSTRLITPFDLLVKIGLKLENISWFLTEVDATNATAEYQASVNPYTTREDLEDTRRSMGIFRSQSLKILKIMRDLAEKDSDEYNQAVVNSGLAIEKVFINKGWDEKTILNFVEKEEAEILPYVQAFFDVLERFYKCDDYKIQLELYHIMLLNFNSSGDMVDYLDDMVKLVNKILELKDNMLTVNQVIRTFGENNEKIYALLMHLVQLYGYPDVIEEVLEKRIKTFKDVRKEIDDFIERHGGIAKDNFKQGLKESKFLKKKKH